MVFSSFCFGSIRLPQHDSGFANGQTTIRRQTRPVREDNAQSKRGVLDAVPDSKPAPAAAVAEQAKIKDKPRKLKWKEEREWASMEMNILSAENEVSDLEAAFAAPDFYAKPRSEIFEWCRRNFASRLISRFYWNR